jgi:AsmA protein
MALDVTGQGATVAVLKKALAGTARFALRDGAVRGINVAPAVRTARVALGGAQASGAGSQEQKTDFSELSGSFRIAGGVAHNDDLVVTSPLLRVTGSGDIDLGHERVDYLVKATVVDTLQGQGGSELQALRGQTVPVRLKGPFNAIGYSVDVAALAQEAARKQVEKKTQDLTKQLGDRLKGLLGKWRRMNRSQRRKA